MQHPQNAKKDLSPILKKFYRLKNRGKPLYIEAYKVMAASTEVIKAQLQAQSSTGISATPYFVCIYQMIRQ